MRIRDGIEECQWWGESRGTSHRPTLLAWDLGERSAGCVEEKGGYGINDYFFFFPFGGPTFGTTFSLPLAF